ncbi:HtaA domain-containing protein [Arthrobacter sp. MA-N2]|uniref:HtaA domain-containing protein n=1 Tax=Arthrobacter sp. MA-N2 TaxID=1101188 RepID=UPI000485C5AA|nr:HtaA domain-containing protein [Arthrobacter sp. MA-N2]
MTEESGLVWGIKESFITYLLNLGDSQYFDDDGAVFVEPNLFRFGLKEVARWDRKTGHGVIEFRGTIVLSAHGGLLYVRITDPWVEFGEHGVALSVLETESSRRIPLVTADTSSFITRDGCRQWIGLPTQLCEEGVMLFNGQYPSGTSMSPITITLNEADIP